LFSSSVQASILKMEAIIPSDVDFQRTTRCYIPEDGTLHDRRCDNLKYYKIILNFIVCIFQKYRVILHYCRGFRWL
jgi:hypothetical protein